VSEPISQRSLFPAQLPPPEPLSGGLKVVAWSQVWGASVGTVTAFRQLVAAIQRTDTELTVLLLLVVLTFYAVSGMGALMLLRGQKAGLRLVKAGLVPQLLHVQGGALAYTVLSGFYAVLGYQDGVLGANVGIISTFTLQFGTRPFPMGVGVNVLAVVLLVYLTRHDPFRESERLMYPARPEADLGTSRG
jgi:hypothetical protein